MKRNAHFKLVLQGSILLQISSAPGSHAEELRLRSGQMLFNQPGSWYEIIDATVSSLFEATFHPGFVRYFHRSPGCRQMFQSDRDLPAGTSAQLQVLRQLSAQRAGTMIGALAGHGFALMLADELRTSQAATMSRAQHAWNGLSEYLYEHFLDPVTRDDVAAHGEMHPAHVSRLCKRFTGTSFTKYLTRLRMQKAAELLTTTTLRVSEIGATCCFPDPCHFSRAFRQQFGDAPGRYRQKGISHSSD